MKWIELTSVEGILITLNVNSICFFHTEDGPNTYIEMSNEVSFHVRESYEEVKALLRDSRTGSAGIRVVKPKRTLKFKKEDT